MYSNELYHHGVKGQRWGVRKLREEIGFRRSRNQENNWISTKKHTSQTISKKPVSEQDIIQRRNRSYNRSLNYVNSKGNTAVSKIGHWAKTHRRAIIASATLTASVAGTFIIAKNTPVLNHLVSPKVLGIAGGLAGTIASAKAIDNLAKRSGKEDAYER